MLKSVGSQKVLYKLTTKQSYCGRSEDTKINNNWSLTLRNFSLLIQGWVTSFKALLIFQGTNSFLLDLILSFRTLNPCGCACKSFASSLASALGMGHLFLSQSQAPRPCLISILSTLLLSSLIFSC